MAPDAPLKAMAMDNHMEHNHNLLFMLTSNLTFLAAIYNAFGFRSEFVVEVHTVLVNWVEDKYVATFQTGQKRPPLENNFSFIQSDENY